MSEVSSRYLVRVLTSRSEMDGVFAEAAGIRAGATHKPEFFLASLYKTSWAPRIVAVWREQSLVGLAYFKERTIAGRRTGLVYGDDTLHRMVLCKDEQRADVLQAAIGGILNDSHIVGLRIVTAPGSCEAAAVAAFVSTGGDFDVAQAAVQHHTKLALPANYELFLRSVGKRTRRNFRYYRRRAERLGLSFVPAMPFKEFEEAAFSLLRQGVVGADRDGIERALAMFRTVDEPLFAGLRTPEGEWVSIIGGWQEGEGLYEGKRLVLFFQMNSDKAHARLSLSLVARSYLVEMLMARGIRDLTFWAGVGTPFEHWTTPLPAIGTYIDKRHRSWKMFRRVVSLIAPKLPARVQELARWVVPCSDKED